MYDVPLFEWNRRQALATSQQAPDTTQGDVERGARAICAADAQDWDALGETYNGRQEQYKYRKFYLAALQAGAAAQGGEWIRLETEDDLPKRKGDGRYEQQNCLVIHKGEIKHLVWNCEHKCWDDDCGDDWYCDALVPSHYMPYPLPPAQPTQKGDAS